MPKLYQSARHPRHWIAYLPSDGWIIFPDREDGWEDRRPARGLDPVHLRQVRPELAAVAGFPVSATPDLVAA